METLNAIACAIGWIVLVSAALFALFGWWLAAWATREDRRDAAARDEAGDD